MESHLLFLQETAVLLGKSSQRLGVAFSMANDEQKIFTTTVSQRTFSSSFSYSKGVGRGAELFVSVPVSYSETQTYDFLFEENKREKRSGFGNAVLGLKKTLLVQNADTPELVGALSFSSPLSSDSVAYPASTAVSVGLIAIKSVDPVVLYGGFSHMKPFGKEASSFGLRFGSAFAVNHKIAFGGEFSSNRQSGGNTTLAPVSIFTLKTTYSIDSKTSIEPSFSIGLSENSPDAVFGISYYRSTQ